MPVTRFATWNVLAQRHVRPDRYSGVDPSALDPALRSASVVRGVIDLARSCTVVALQEVEPDLVRALELSGAHVLHVRRPGSDEGVALVSLAAPMVVVSAGVSRDRRRVFCGAVVEGVGVVSAHLDWVDPASGSTSAVEQARDLLDWIDAEMPGLPVVMGADINGTWDLPVGRLLASHGFASSVRGVATAAVDGIAVELDVVAARGASVVGRAPEGLPAAGEPVWVPSSSWPSDHLPVVAEVGR